MLGISLRLVHGVYKSRLSTKTVASIDTPNTKSEGAPYYLQPRNIAREAAEPTQRIGGEGVGARGPSIQATPYRKNPTPLKTSILLEKHSRSRPDASSTMADIYGGAPAKDEAPNVPGNEASSPRSHYRLKDGTSSPLPNTGSPVINRHASKNLPQWMENLRQTLISQGPVKQDNQLVDKVPVSAAQSTSRRERHLASRMVISPDNTLKQLGLWHKIDEVTENLCLWFLVRILRPLSTDIHGISREFAAAGLDHLSPPIPASFSMFSKNSSGSTDNGSYFLAPSGFAASARPQTLLELCHKYPSDALVQKRVRVERYLSFAGLASQRAAVIRRIHEMASDGLLKSLNLMSTTLRLHPADSPPCDEDASILMHLFCAFMDEKLPSEQYLDPQPFSTRHFVSVEEQPSERLDAIQIHQVQRHPPHFRVIAEDRIFEIDSGSRSVFQAIIVLVEYLHRKYSGFLGVGNLASPAICLTSILDSDA